MTVLFCSECVGTGCEYDPFTPESTGPCEACGGTGHWDSLTTQPTPGPCVYANCAGCALAAVPVSLEAVKAETTTEWGVRWTGVEPTVVTDRGAAEADVRRLVEANPEICEAVAREVTEWRPVSTEGDS